MHPRARTSPRPLLAAAALGLALAVLPASAASAHDQLETASPAAGSSVTTVSSVTLGFEEPLVELGRGRNGIVVLGEDGRHYETACATVSGDDLRIPVALGAAGTYRVQWRGVSDDGHQIGDTYSFTYAPAAGTAAAAGSAAGPSCGATGAAASSEEPRSGLPTAAVVAIAAAGGVLLVALAVVAALVIRLRRRDRTPV